MNEMETLRYKIQYQLEEQRKVRALEIQQQILRAQDCSVSKRQLLGLTRNKRRASDPLTGQKGLF